ncbi:MAG: hypothetical protein CM15mV11_1120 [Caudoviricetes sp.]|nr:MAG: hypothetical protein CM15mV11_1120 [Caudoviricetes sp.]
MNTLKERWELKRDSAYRPVYEKLKPGVFEEKLVSDLNLRSGSTLKFKERQNLFTTI